jgi:hypothetical protein
VTHLFTLPPLPRWEWLALACLLVAVHTCHARADVVAHVGLGKGVVSHEGFERFASVGYAFHPTKSTSVKPELGGFLDASPGMANSWFVGVPVGFRVVSGAGLYALAAMGPAYISDPDAALGSHFQFDIEMGFGLVDVDGVGIGFTYKHLSNAGLWQPNRGRDFLTLQVTMCKW